MSIFFLSFFLTLLYSFTLPLSTLASNQVFVSHHISYTYNDQGKSTIVQDISLKNLTTQYYPTQYQIQLVGENPQNITGSFPISTEPQGPDATLVTVDITKPAIGKDKVTRFTLKYQGKPALHNGQVWEISLPRLTDPKSIDDLTLDLTIPDSFGKPAYLSPAPINSQDNVYSFSKEQIIQSPLVGAFGNFQTFSFTMTYHLTGTTKIILPPDTAYQRVFYDSLVPSPTNIDIDSDGNWLATYKLKSKQSIDVVASGQVHILPEPITSFPETSKTDLSVYLKPTRFWPSADPQITALTKSLNTPEKIYDYVVATLEYDYTLSSNRRGALTALTLQKGLCTEFTDLFITLARAAGIPAREINGYAYSNDLRLRPLSLVTDVLHAWPQYWDTDRQVWVSVDPTWGKTTGGVDYFHKLDFNHFAFAIHGQADDTPAFTGKNIKVSYSSYKDYPNTVLTQHWENPLLIIPFVPAKFNLVFDNPTGQAVYLSPVTVPPFSRLSVPYTYTFTKPFDFSTQTVMTYNIPRRLFLPWQITLALTISLTIVSGCLYLQRLVRGHHLRR